MGNDEFYTQLDRISQKRNELDQDISHIRTGLDNHLLPWIDKLQQLSRIAQRLGTGILPNKEFMVQDKPLHIYLDTINNVRFSIEAKELSGAWGREVKDIKWMATNIYDICDRLKEVIAEYEKIVKEKMDEVELRLDQEQEYLAPQTILQRMKGDNIEKV